MSSVNTDELRKLPQVEKILNESTISDFIMTLGHSIVKKSINNVLENIREELLAGEKIPDYQEIISRIKSGLKEINKTQLTRVVNATGIVIHTNLGRAPLSRKLLLNMADELSGYLNLEYDLISKQRGKRGEFLSTLLSELSGAEAALVVNNNAASLFLIISEFANGKNVLISRGELVQIGGDFRIPDILTQGGANLIEIGTTNITKYEDYKNALLKSEDISIILKVHKSNFKIQGFSQEVDTRELSRLKTEDTLLVEDLGSGNLISNIDGLSVEEPTIKQVVSKGVDLVCFSGDKLLGGPQCGIIIGKKVLIDKLRKNPLYRVLRPDKIVFYLLWKTIIEYMNNKSPDIGIWNILSTSLNEIDDHINSVLENIQHKDNIEKANISGRFGGGSLPDKSINSLGIRIYPFGQFKSAEQIFEYFVENEEIPVIGYIKDGAYYMDFRTVLDCDIPFVRSALERLFI